MGRFKRRETAESPAAEQITGFLLQTDERELRDFNQQDLEDALVDLVEQPFLTVILSPLEPVEQTTFLQAAPFDGPDETLWFDLQLGFEGESLRVLHWATPAFPEVLAVFYQYASRRVLPDLSDWEAVDLSDAQTAENAAEADETEV